jgi:ATP-dependent RNA helicase DeaD
MTTFAELGLNETIVSALTKLGYEAPTPIQENTIPILLAGHDVIGQAQTGTGKTAAFALPILQKIDPARPVTQALILAPTRELAMQVAEALHSYASTMPPVSILPIYGGAPIVTQLKRLDRGVHVVVGTPGRLIDHLDRGSLDLSNVSMVVLDEADEMLKMGFVEEVERILSSIPDERQIALFSATMPDEVSRIAKRYLRNPQQIEVAHAAMTAPDIEQRFLNVSESQKLEVLTQILELEASEAVLIFRRTKLGVAELAEKLEGRGFSAVAMHGDMNQQARESVIRRLRAGQVEIVVATDVAARGLDVEQITHVINYDIPHDVEVYVHRIGRTGRAGRSGKATLFITPRERRMMREIERYTNMQIKPMKMPTRADVAARRVAVFKETLRKQIQEGDLELYLQLVEQLVDEGPYDMAEIAAAAARMANSSRSLAAQPDPEPINYPAAPPRPSAAAPRSYPPAADRAERFARPAPPDRPAYDRTANDRTSYDRPSDDRPTAPRAESQPIAGDSEPKVRLSMAVGKEDGIRPGDIVGSIANEAGISGKDIGPIDIRDNISYVTIPARYADLVIEKTARAKFRGRNVNLQMATGGEDDRPAPRKPPFRDRDDRDSRPPRPYGDRPRPPYRADNDRPARPPYRADNDRPARPPYRADNDRPARPPYRADNDRPARPPYRADNDRPARPPYRGDRPDNDRPRPPYRAEGDRPRPPFRRPDGDRPFGGPKRPGAGGGFKGPFKGKPRPR